MTTTPKTKTGSGSGKLRSVEETKFNELLQSLPDKKLTGSGITDTFQYAIDRELLERMLLTHAGADKATALLDEMPYGNKALLVDARMQEAKTSSKNAWARVCFVRCRFGGKYFSPFKNCSFFHSFFDGAIFSVVDFQGCSFIRSNFRETEFDVCTFVKPKWTDTSFEDVTWDYYSVANAEIRDCVLRRCHLLNGSVHGDSELLGNNFEEVRFKDARFTDMRWLDGSLRACEFAGGAWDRFEFGDCIVRGTRFSELSLNNGAFREVKDGGGNSFVDVELCDVDGLRVPDAPGGPPLARVAF